MQILSTSLANLLDISSLCSVVKNALVKAVERQKRDEVPRCSLDKCQAMGTVLINPRRHILR